MRIEEGLKFANEILALGNLELLATEAAEILHKHNNNEKLTSKEKFIIGLAYSEFYATDSSESAYNRAEIKRQSFCKKLNIEGYKFLKTVESLL